MKNLFSLLIISLFLISCGGENAETNNGIQAGNTPAVKEVPKPTTTITPPTANPYYITLKKGAEVKVEAASELDCSYTGDAKEVKFTIDDGTLAFSGLYTDMKKGFIEPIGKVYPGSVTIGDQTADGKVKVLKVGKGKPTKLGVNVEVMGIFTGNDGEKGKFNVSLFQTK